MTGKRIKMLKGRVIDGAVWPKGSSPLVNNAQAEELVRAGEAEYLPDQKTADKKDEPVKDKSD